jgi:hydrogenase maturation protease
VVCRVVGIGQRAGGPALIDHLRSFSWGADVELVEIQEPSALLPLLEAASRVIVVDAALGAGPPGDVLVLRTEDIEQTPLSPVSTHGMSVGQAITLARVLSAESICQDIVLVAIAAERPAGIQYGLSAAVLAALPRAAEVVVRLVGETQKKDLNANA